MSQATDALLAERGKTHGEYTEHARCTQSIMRALMRERNWDDLPDIIKETCHMVAHKLGRVVTGDPLEPDHYDDIAGYARLVSQRIPTMRFGAEKQYPQYTPPLDKVVTQVGPGTPEDGGHHADYAAELEDALTHSDELLLTSEDLRHARFRTRRGGIVTLWRTEMLAGKEEFVSSSGTHYLANGLCTDGNTALQLVERISVAPPEHSTDAVAE